MSPTAARPHGEVIPGETELDDAYRDALDRAGRLLAQRSRARGELRTRLRATGFDDDVVERVLERLEALGLVDDAEFARRWVEERSARKGLAPRALVAELVAKGVERAVAEEAAAATAGDEELRARELAARLLSKLGDRPLAVQAHRIQQALMRRGFGPEVAEGAARAVLPPEGWD